MLHSEDNNGGNPLRSIGVDDDVYTGELKEDIKDVARAVLKGDRDITKLRSFYWPRFLRTVVEASDCEGNRKHYRALSSKHQPKSGGLLTTQFKGMDPNVCNPLSKASENPWNQEHKKTDILNEIWVDVSRTNYSNREWFSIEDNQRSMQRILYVWCKERNKDYRQGMSDIATVLLYGLVGDDTDNCIGRHGLADGEADAFMLFDTVMSGTIQHAEMFYSESTGNGNTLLPSQSQPKSKILKRCEYVFDKLLPQADEDLSNHLHNSAKIAPSLFLMRWIRLIFAREMHVVEVLRLWDFIFADSYLHWSATGELSMPLVDFMAVSMILQVRSTLINGDNTACLQRLMRYPPVDCVEPLVGRALRLRDGDAALSPRIVCDDTVEDDEKVLTMTMEGKSKLAPQLQVSPEEPLQRAPQIDPLMGEHTSLSSLFGTVVHTAVGALSTAITEGRALPQSYANKSNTAEQAGSPTVVPPEQIRMPRDLADSWDDETVAVEHDKGSDEELSIEVNSSELAKWQRALDTAIVSLSSNTDPHTRESAVDVLRDISASIGQVRRQLPSEK